MIIISTHKCIQPLRNMEVLTCQDEGWKALRLHILQFPWHKVVRVSSYWNITRWKGVGYRGGGHKFQKQCKQKSLGLVESILTKHKAELAVWDHDNHKTSSSLTKILRSQHILAILDFIYFGITTILKSLMANMLFIVAANKN